MRNTVRAGLVVAAMASGLAVAVGGVAHADVIHLDSGASRECVLIEVSDEWVVFETDMGRAKLPRHKITAITRDPDDGNRHLLKRWQAARAATAARARARVRREQVDRLQREALGLVKYDGEWITPEERLTREAAKQQAAAAALALDRTEAAEGHHFYYDLWLTPEAYAAVRKEEEQLGAHQAELEALHREIALLNERISGARMIAIGQADLDAMEERAGQIATMKKQSDRAVTEAGAVRERGDAVAARITARVARERARLERLLAERGEPADAVAYLRGPS